MSISVLYTQCSIHSLAHSLLRLHPPRDEPRRLVPARIMRHALPHHVPHLELAQARALKRRTQLRFADAVPVRDEPVVRLGEELAAVRLGLDVRDDEGPPGLEERRERACGFVDRGEVVVGRAALRGA